MVQHCDTKFPLAVTGRRATIQGWLEIEPALNEEINCAHNDVWEHPTLTEEHLRTFKKNLRDLVPLFIHRGDGWIWAKNRSALPRNCADCQRNNSEVGMLCLRKVSFGFSSILSSLQLGQVDNFMCTVHSSGFWGEWKARQAFLLVILCMHLWFCPLTTERGHVMAQGGLGCHNWHGHKGEENGQFWKSILFYYCDL